MDRKTKKCFTCGKPCTGYKCKKCVQIKKYNQPSRYKNRRKINHIKFDLSIVANL